MLIETKFDSFIWIYLQEVVYTACSKGTISNQAVLWQILYRTFYAERGGH